MNLSTSGSPTRLRVELPPGYDRRSVPSSSGNLTWHVEETSAGGEHWSITTAKPTNDQLWFMCVGPAELDTKTEQPILKLITLALAGRSSVNMPLNLIRAFSVVVVLCTLVACAGPASPGDTGNGSVDYIEDPTTLTSEPIVELPADFSTTDDVRVVPSALTAPDRIRGSFVPIGPVWDVTIGSEAHVSFAPSYAILRFVYQPESLVAAGLLEEFRIFVYDTADGWIPVAQTEWGFGNGSFQILGKTEHFSSFVATASAPATGQVIGVPELDQVFPDGIGGTGNATFARIDESFRYYIDRDYYLVPVLESAQNARTFADLGLDGSVGIATFNGGSVQEPFSNHKHYTGTDYIVFEAHMNLDLYLMYDGRGGTGPEDTSQDAPWIATAGFTDTIDGEAYYVETTDPVGLYRVYRRSYANGDLIRLQGNWHGIATSQVQTNYWLILKPQGNTQSDTGDLVVDVDTDPPGEVSALEASTNAGTVTLRWEDPTDTDFSKVEILYGSPDATIQYSGPIDSQGTSISGLPRAEHTFLIRSVDIYGNGSAGIAIQLNPHLSVCGDGILEPALGEECDDGNVDNGDGCTSTCRIDYSVAPDVTDLRVYSGGGLVQLYWRNPDIGYFERVEVWYGAPDADTLFPDTTDLQRATITDLPDAMHTFFIQAVYWYDIRSPGRSFQLNPRDGFCGDGVVEAPLGEECDDGNTDNGDGCSSTCTWE
jgi:cysteine-rich repeat protein